MGVRILTNEDEGMAILYDSVTEVPLSLPIFHDSEDGTSAAEVAEAFEHYALSAGWDDLRVIPPSVLGALETEFYNQLDRRITEWQQRTERRD